MDARVGVGIEEPRCEKWGRFDAQIRANGRLLRMAGGAKLAKFGAKKKLFIFNDLTILRRKLFQIRIWRDRAKPIGSGGKNLEKRRRVICPGACASAGKCLTPWSIRPSESAIEGSKSSVAGSRVKSRCWRLSRLTPASQNFNPTAGVSPPLPPSVTGLSELGPLSKPIERSKNFLRPSARRAALSASSDGCFDCPAPVAATLL